MVVGGSRPETLDPGFVLLGTCKQGVPIRNECSLYTGHKEENPTHKQEIELMISNIACKALIRCESHGPTVIKSSFKTGYEEITMNFIHCYTLNNESDEDDKDQLYKKLN
ncbi:unnamed protein product [Schistosoma margrebowiei]|uniref:Uncharacterized protein n=1 Tax=Schistosoma margrebowiei TaxID=48269 RepID=A0A183MN75_9TREM|nr:unnamed protein product [Schistosoma margrebowiei]